MDFSVNRHLTPGHPEMSALGVENLFAREALVSLVRFPNPLTLGSQVGEPDYRQPAALNYISSHLLVILPVVPQKKGFSLPS